MIQNTIDRWCFLFNPYYALELRYEGWKRNKT